MFALAQPASLGDFDVTPELDLALDGLALRARSDRAARDALFQALAFKVDRFVQRHCRRYRLPGRVVDPDDVAQEAFLVFCDLVQRWPGQRSFVGYFFHLFPWRLARAVSHLEWSVPLEPVGEALDEVLFVAPDDALALIDAGAGLRAFDRTVLELRVGYGMTAEEAAETLGVTARTVFRAWARIRRDLGEAEYTGPRKQRLAIVER
jgi:RNA polymerase sigma factor (sigma-70 family)